MATISKVRRLTNPGMFSKVKRKLSPLQKMFFGSKRQRAAVKRNGSAQRRAKREQHKYADKYGNGGPSASSMRVYSSRFSRSLAHGTTTATRRKKNVGSIITV